MDEPIPTRVAVAEVGLAHELSVGDIHQIARDRDADLHVLDFITPLVLIGPPDARADAFARGVNPGTALGILAEGKAAEAARRRRGAGIVEVDGVLAPGVQRLRKIDEHGAKLAFVLQRGSPEQNLVDIERRVQVELNTRVVLEHLEADRVLPADDFLIRVDADVEVVVEQVVVGAIGAVGAAEDICLRGYVRALRALRRGCSRLSRSGAGLRGGQEWKTDEREKESEKAIARELSGHKGDLEGLSVYFIPAMGKGSTAVAKMPEKLWSVRAKSPMSLRFVDGERKQKGVGSESAETQNRRNAQHGGAQICCD